MATDDNPATDTDAFVAAFLAERKDAFGVSGVDLVQRNKLNTGSGKFTVFTFEQRIENLPVHASLLRVVVLRGGTEKIPYVGMELVPHPESPLPADVISAEEAVAVVQAVPAYGNLTTYSAPEKVIYEDETKTLHRTWRFSGSGGMESYLFFVDTSTSEIVAAMDMVFHGTVGGTVSGFATGCTAPDDPDCANCCSAFDPTNPDSCPQEQPMYGAKVGCTAQDDKYADVNGVYDLGEVGAGSVTVQSVLESQWVTVYNRDPEDDFDELSVSGTGNPPEVVNLKFNPTGSDCPNWPLEPSEYDTAQVNAFVGVQKTRNWLAELQPSYPGLDRNVSAYVNMTSGTCNAYYIHGVDAVTFFASGGGCNNAAYSTVVSHEYGHFLVDQRIPWYGDLPFLSFHEGVGDTVAALVWNTEVLGLDLYDGGLPHRNVDMPNVQLGECLSGFVPWSRPCICGEPHCQGLALAGAFWDLRKGMLKCTDDQGDGDPCNPDVGCPDNGALDRGVCRFDNVCEGGTNDGLPCDRNTQCPSPEVCTDDHELEVRFTDFLTITHGRLDELVLLHVLIADDDDGDLFSTPPTPNYYAIVDSFVTLHNWPPNIICEPPQGDVVVVKWDAGDGVVTAPPGTYDIEYGIQNGVCLPNVRLKATESPAGDPVLRWFLGRTLSSQPASLGSVFPGWDGPAHDVVVEIGTDDDAPCDDLYFVGMGPQSPVNYASVRLNVQGDLVGSAQVEPWVEGRGGALISGTIAGNANRIVTGGIGVGQSQPGELQIGGAVEILTTDRVDQGSTLTLGALHTAVAVKWELQGTLHLLTDLDNALVVVRQDSDGDLLVEGDITSSARIWFQNDMAGDIVAVGDMLGAVFVQGRFTGDICANNITPGGPVPPNVDIDEFCGTICGLGWSCPVFPAPYPHNRPKNRYISFGTDKAANDGRNIAFQVMLTSLELGSCSGNGAPCGVDQGVSHCGTCSVNGNPCVGVSPDCVWSGPAQTCDPTGETCVNDLSDSVGRSWWVGAASPLGNDVHLLVSEEFRNVSQDWPVLVHVADCEVVPVGTYSVRALDTDTGAVSEWLSVSTIDRPGSNYWADCVGPLGGHCTENWALCNGQTDCAPGDSCVLQWGPPDGATNFDDVTAQVLLFQSIPGYTVPDITWVDIHGNDSGIGAGEAFDPPNYANNFTDTQFIVLAFQGRPYPYYDPGDCPDVGEWPGTGGSFAPEGAMAGGGGYAPLTGGVVSLVPSADQFEPNETVTVEVFIDAVENLGAYQVSLDVVGGTAGSLELEAVAVDTGRQDYVFSGASAMTGTSVVHGRLGAALSNPGGWTYEAPAYVGTFTYRASPDAAGVFYINALGFPESFVNDPKGSRIDVSMEATTGIGCDVECMTDTQCDDANECTVDTCVLGACAITPVAAATSCDDGWFCTVGEECDGNGSCAGGTSPCTKHQVCCEFWDECRTGSCFDVPQ